VLQSDNAQNWYFAVDIFDAVAAAQAHVLNVMRSVVNVAALLPLVAHHVTYQYVVQSLIPKNIYFCVFKLLAVFAAVALVLKVVRSVVLTIAQVFQPKTYQ